jgi:hypothetical protein
MNNNYNAYKIVETFNNPTSFESNSLINVDMMASSLNNLINNCKNDVLQKNTVELSALALASNEISVLRTKAENIIVKDIELENNADLSISVNISENTINTVADSFSSSIIEQINDNINNNYLVNQQNMKQLTNAMNSLSLQSNILKPSIQDQINGIIGLSTNKNDVNLQIKRMLNIDNSFTTNVSNKVTNDIKNIITQTNFGSCAAVALAKNNIFLYDVKVENNIIIDDINMNARAQVNLECTFNQKNVSTITNKIMTNISTNINNLYAGIRNEPIPDANKYKFLNLLSKAISDKIITAGNLVTASKQSSLPVLQSTLPETLSTLPKSLSTLPETLSTLPKSLSTLPETLSTLPETLPETIVDPPSSTLSLNTSLNASQKQSSEPSVSQTYQLYFLFGSLIFVIIIFIIIINIYWKSNK